MTDVEKEILSDAIKTAIESERKVEILTKIIIALDVVIGIMILGYFIW